MAGVAAENPSALVGLSAMIGTRQGRHPHRSPPEFSPSRLLLVGRLVALFSADLRDVH